MPDAEAGDRQEDDFPEMFCPLLLLMLGRPMTQAQAGGFQGFPQRLGAAHNSHPEPQVLLGVWPGPLCSLCEPQFPPCAVGLIPNPVSEAQTALKRPHELGSRSSQAWEL